MKPRQKRIAIIVGGLASIGIATYFVLKALDSNIALFYTPTQVAAGEAPKDRTFRIGGLVKVGTVQRNDMTVRFIVTDTAMEIPVAYTGILPDLFREGQSIVATGALKDGHFVATEVLAKHDETYMPKEVKDAIEKAKQAHADKPAG